MKNLLLVLLFVSTAATAQRIPESGFDKVRIAEVGKTIQADLKPVGKNIKTDADRVYYWYSGNSIHSTQGGYSGRVLNGNYTEYYPNKNLKEQGAFKLGLKDGIWKDWNDNGIMVQRYTWRKGLRSGSFSLYDEQGQLKQSGEYKDDLLQGKVKTYSAKDFTTITYHNGVIVHKKPSSFWKKINIFKRRGTAKQKTNTKPVNQQ